MDNKLVGQNIRKYRRFRDMSQKELAKAVGYATKSSINKIEAGESSVPIPRLTQIANVLRVPLQTLMSEDASKESMVCESINSYGVANTNQKAELEFIVQNRLEHASTSELIDFIKAQMKEHDKVYKKMLNQLDMAEVLFNKMQREYSKDSLLVTRYNQLTSDNKRTLNAMLDTMLMAQKNTATAENSDGEKE